MRTTINRNTSTKMRTSIFLVVIHWFSFVQTFDQCVEPCLIFINHTEISYKSVLAFDSTLDHLTPFTTFKASLTQGVKAFDYHYEKKLIFWFQKTTRKIFSSGFLYNSALQDLGVFVSDVVGLAVDWNYDNLYWVDQDYKSLEVSTISGQHQSVLLKRDSEIPQYIIYGGNGNIFTAWKLGSDYIIFRSVMGTTKEISKLKNVIGLAIDRSSSRLFIAADGKVRSVDFDGSSTSSMSVNMQSLVLGYGMYYFKPQSKSVIETFYPNGKKQTLTTLNVDSGDVDDKIVMYDNYSVTFKEVEFCNSVGCDHLCLYAPSRASYVCACGDGYKLSADGKSCTSIQAKTNLISVGTKKNELNFIDIYDTSNPESYTLKNVRIKNVLSSKSTTMSSQIYAKGSALYFLDDVNGMLCEFNVSSNKLTILDASFSFSNGHHLQYDDISRLFYFINALGTKLLIANKDGTTGILLEASDFVFTELIISSKLRYIGTIEKKTDNTYQFTIYYLTGEKIRTFPLDSNKVGPVTFDEVDKKVIWYEHHTKTLVIHDLSSANIQNKNVLVNGVEDVTMLTTHKRFLIWITKYKKVFVASLAEQNPTPVLVTQFNSDVHYAAAPTSLIAGSFSYRCSQNNGGCSHFCLQKTDNAFICRCPEGMVLNTMKLKCIHQNSNTTSNVTELLFSSYSSSGDIQSEGLYIMTRRNGFPQTFGVGQFNIGTNGSDDKFEERQIITWQNTAGKAGVYQWLGWRDPRFQYKMLRFNVWLKFIDTLPKKSRNFGIKIYGVVYNDFIEDCQVNKWCHIVKTVRCGKSADFNYVLLIFDTINHIQTVHISHLSVAVLAEEPICPSPCLYYTNGRSIQRVSVNSGGTALNGPPQLLHQYATSSIKAIGIHYERDFLFWSDSIKIYKASTTGNAIHVIIDDDAVDVRGIAVDELNNVIYWTDYASEKISVSTLDGDAIYTITHSRIKKPTSIVVEPFYMNGLVFWINNVDGLPTLGRSNLAGQNKTFFKMEPYSYPSHLSIDRSHRTLYWNSKNGVKSLSYVGENGEQYTFNSSSGFALYPAEGLMYGVSQTGLTVKQYFPDIATKPSIAIANMSGNSIIKIATQFSDEVLSICFGKTCNSGLCLGGQCQCSVGYKVKDGGCIADKPYLKMIVMKNNGFYMYKKFSNGVVSNEISDVDFLNEASPVSFDVDWVAEQVFWIDSHFHSIMKTSLARSKTLLLLSRSNPNLLSLKYDHIRSRLYWLENGAVYGCSSDNGSMVTEIYSAPSVQIILVAFGIRKGFIFSYSKDSSIWRGSLQGNDEIYIHSERNIKTLAVDEYSEQLFFTTNDELKACSFDGHNSRVVISETLYIPSTESFVQHGDLVKYTSSLQIYGDNVYWFQKRKQVLYKANKWLGSSVKVEFGIAANTSFAVDFKMAVVHAEKKSSSIKNYTFSYLGSSLTGQCAAKTCPSSIPPEPSACPAGYQDVRVSEGICGRCDQIRGFGFACKCTNWVTCNHRWATDVGCNKTYPFMNLRGRECLKTIRPGFCPFYDCKKETRSSDACVTDNECTNKKKCCATKCGKKCLDAVREETSECALNNGGCSHVCVTGMYGEAVCQCPVNMKLDENRETCVADVGFCSYASPCLNSTCVDYPDTYVCVCPSSRYGDHCELGYCLSNPCNNGKCVEQYGDFKCECQTGFTGRYCEVRDVCTDHLCSNNSTCVKDSTSSSYKCICGHPYYGQYCEEKDICKSSPCKHGGRCIATSDGFNFECSCVKNYVGEYCEDLHPCLRETPCMNGGVCSLSGETYLCLCAEFYTGDNCQIYYGDNIASINLKEQEGRTITKQSFQKTMASVYTDFCSENDCINGGVPAKRKRRSNSITILPKHIVVVIGYPKVVGIGEVQVLYTVVVPLTPGSTVDAKLIDTDQLLKAAQNSDKKLSTELGASIVKVSKYQEPKPTSAPTSAPSDSSDNNIVLIGAAAGGGVIVLVVLIVTIGCCVVKRRKDAAKDVHITMQQANGSSVYMGKLNPSFHASLGVDPRYAASAPFYRPTRSTVGAAPPPPDYNDRGASSESFYQGIEDYSKNDDVFYLESHDVKAGMREEVYTGLNNYNGDDYAGLNVGRAENPYTGLVGLTAPQVESSYITPNVQRRADTMSVPDDVLARERERSRQQVANSDSKYAVYGGRENNDYLMLEK